MNGIMICTEDGGHYPINSWITSSWESLLSKQLMHIVALSISGNSQTAQEYLECKYSNPSQSIMNAGFPTVRLPSSTFKLGNAILPISTSILLLNSAKTYAEATISKIQLLKNARSAQTLSAINAYPPTILFVRNVLLLIIWNWLITTLVPA